MDLRYPIGRYQPVTFTPQLKEERIADLRFFPGLLERALENLDAGQLATPYREVGWTVHQVVHHLADSHMNAFIRFKLGLTEDNPTIKPYEEALWATLPDTQQVPVNVSLTLLHALHRRWVVLLEHMQPDVWERTVYHPQHDKEFTLWDLLGMYAWHSKHHVAHITALRERMGW